jgi:site-specific DNA-methyltransferase (adenine-specific)
MKLINGEALHQMGLIESGSVDLVLCDPPYGTTACKWDSIIPLEPMWEQLNRIATDEASFVFTSSQPFTTTLIASNMKMFKYCLVWEKEQAHTALNAKNQPLKVHEDIVVFSKRPSTYSKNGSMVYNPQMTEGKPYKSNPKKDGNHTMHGSSNMDSVVENTGTRYPRSVLKFKRERGLHPTQKPVSMFAYLAETYSNPGDTVLDFTMGSGTTGVACVNINRNFIGIEMDEGYYNIAKKRIDGALVAISEEFPFAV